MLTIHVPLLLQYTRGLGATTKIQNYEYKLKKKHKYYILTGPMDDRPVKQRLFFLTYLSVSLRFETKAIRSKQNI